MKIVLGPTSECHTGVHAGLLEWPPSGVCYRAATSLHHFVWRDHDVQAPIRGSDIGEFVTFVNAPDAPAHSARWPVVARRSWATDMDDFLYPIIAGRYGFTAAFTAAEAWLSTRSARYANLLACRITNMTWALMHDSCKGVLLRSRREHTRVSTWLRQLLPPEQAESLLAKLHIVYPACPPVGAAVVQRKWDKVSPIRVVFCGRHFEVKNGALALRVMRRLLDATTEVHCTYIGAVPDSALLEGLDPQRFDYFAQLSRSSVLDVLARSHVLFHPSKFESLGVVFIEAAAAGVAVVTACGEGMSHLPELFEQDFGAAVIDRRRVKPEDEEDAFLTELLTLVRSEETARRHGRSNHDRSIRGATSISNRNRTLTHVYETMRERPAAAGLTLDELPRAGASVLTVSEPELIDIIQEYVRVEKMSGFYSTMSMDF
jgi:glycosyltransferase involved in cell wall biosynthesis